MSISKIKPINFHCVYVKNRKKVYKFFKVNAIANKYVIDIKKIKDEEGIGKDGDLTFIKILIFNKIQKALEKGKDVYYIPDFDDEFSISKLMNLKQIIGHNSTFNILFFYEDFSEENQRDVAVKNEAFENLCIFDNSNILRDY